MSVEHRPPEPDAEDPSSVELSYADPSPTSASRTACSPALDRRIERARLLARIAALERALVESERHRQAVVDRYELVLADCEADDSRVDPGPRERPLRSRVLGRLRR